MSQDTAAAGSPQAGKKVGNYRWGIIALLFAALAINYTHRQMLGLFKGDLEHQFGWNEENYAGMVFWFQCAYALGQFGFGRFLDVAGVRLGYAIAYTVWTVAHMLTGVVATPLQFIMARFGLGLGEAGSFPSSLKAISEWFPQKERALAAGIFNSGTSIGVMVAAAAVPFLALSDFKLFDTQMHGLGWGWRGSFIFTGAVSLLWLVAWLMMYRRPSEHPKLSRKELDHIQQDIQIVEGATETSEKIPFFKVIAKKETWIYAMGKFMIDPIWWLYLFWLPDFLHKTYGLNISSFGPPLIVIYLMSDVGSVAGGWLSSTLISRGVSVNVARKTALFVFALFAVPMFFVHNVHELWPAVLVIGLATIAHQGFSCNIYTLPSDLFPRAAVGTVLGIGGAIGAVGGMGMSLLVGWILKTATDAGNPASGYTIIFTIAAFTYLTAALLIHLLTPKLKPVSF